MSTVTSLCADTGQRRRGGGGGGRGTGGGAGGLSLQTRRRKQVTHRHPASRARRFAVDDHVDAQGTGEEGCDGSAAGVSTMHTSGDVAVGICAVAAVGLAVERRLSWIRLHRLG